MVNKKNLLTLIVSIVFSLIFFELLLSLFFPQRLYNECFSNQHPDSGGPVIEKNESYGWYNKKDYHVCRYQPDTNKKIDIHHNSRGLRSNYEHSYEKPEGITRVLLLGDSNTYGFGLAQNETEAYLLQEKLGDNYEVINLGVIGYGTDQEFLLFEDEGLKYDPDIVILNIHSNDFSDVIQTKGIDNIEKPLLEVVPNQLAYNTTTKDEQKITFDNPIEILFRSHSHFYTLISDRLSDLNNTIGEKKNFFEINTLIHNKNSAFMWINNYNHSFLDSQEYSYTGLINNSIAVMHTYIGFFYGYAKENDFNLIITYTTNKIEVYPKEQEIFVSQYKDISIEDFDFEILNKILTKITSENNIAFISYYSLAKDEGGFYFKTDGHKSPHGTNIVAEQLFKKIKEIEEQG